MRSGSGELEVAGVGELARSPEAYRDGERAIAITRLLDAPRELVWRLWTDPEHLAEWWGPRGFRTETHAMDVRPGGAWEFVMHGPDGRDYANRNVYAEVVRPERLVYEHVTDPVHHVTVTFADEGGRTRVAMHMLFESRELRDRTAEEYGAVEGMTQTIDRLAERLAALREAA